MFPSKKVKTNSNELCIERVTWLSKRDKIKRLLTHPAIEKNVYINCDGGIILKEQIVKSKLLRVMYE